MTRVLRCDGRRGNVGTGTGPAAAEASARLDRAARRPYRDGMTAADFEAAGLYNPGAPGAAERLALLEWLAAQGATLEQLVAGAARNKLTSLAADMKLRPGPRFSAR